MGCSLLAVANYPLRMSVIMMAMQISGPEILAGWEQAGVVSILMIALVLVTLSFWREWVVSGKRYAQDIERERAEKEQYKSEVQELTKEFVRNMEEQRHTVREVIYELSRKRAP